MNVDLDARQGAPEPHCCTRRGIRRSASADAPWLARTVGTSPYSACGAGARNAPFCSRSLGTMRLASMPRRIHHSGSQKVLPHLRDNRPAFEWFKRKRRPAPSSVAPPLMMTRFWGRSNGTPRMTHGWRPFVHAGHNRCLGAPPWRDTESPALS